MIKFYLFKLENNLVLNKIQFKPVVAHLLHLRNIAIPAKTDLTSCFTNIRVLAQTSKYRTHWLSLSTNSRANRERCLARKHHTEWRVQAFSVYDWETRGAGRVDPVLVMHADSLSASKCGPLSVKIWICVVHMVTIRHPKFGFQCTPWLWE